MEAASRLLIVSVVLVAYLAHWPGAYLNLELRLIVYAILTWNAAALVVILRRRSSPAAVSTSGPIGGSDPSSATSGTDWALQLVQALLIGLGYWVLTTLDTNYFLQDDNVSQFTPVIIAACRSFFEQGIFGNWNPYQFMGSPTADVGTYALTYPPTYLAYLIAKIIGRPDTWNNVFYLIHVFPAGWITLSSFRSFGLNRPIALAASLCFVFNGYNLIAGRSWYYMIPQMLLVPVLAWLIINLKAVTTRRWFWLAAISIGVGPHAGNSQMWFYSLLFLGLGALLHFLLERRFPSRQETRSYVGACTTGLGISFPVVLVQLHFLSTVKRFPQGLSGTANNLLTALLPFPLARGQYLADFGTAYINMGHFYYAGTTFTVAALLATALLYGKWVRKQNVAKDTAFLVMLLLGLLAIILSLGEVGFLWRVLALAPPFSLFSQPVKLILYAHTFWIIGGALFLQRLLHRLAQTRRERATWAVSVLTLALVGYHLFQSHWAFVVFGARSYTPLPESQRRAIEENANHSKYIRVDAYGPLRDRYEFYPHSLVLNFATFYDIAAVWGYDPLVKFSKENRQWTLPWQKALCGDTADPGFPRYVLRKANGCNGEKGEGPGELEKFLRLSGASSRVVFSKLSKQITVTKVEDPDPIVFEVNRRGNTYPYQADFSGVTIQNPSNRPPQAILVNFLKRTSFRAHVDGTAVPIETDEWNRMIVKPTSNWKQITLRYVPAWWLGTILGFALSLFGWALARGSVRRTGLVGTPT